jgi:beta-glucanase (GH16 family)
MLRLSYARRVGGALAVCAHIAAAAWLVASPQDACSPSSDAGWKLAFCDDFEGPPGTPPDSTKWGYDVGDGSPRNPGWGNYERQIYTKSTENVFLDGSGNLVIRALRRNGGYTSGRIKTQDTFPFKYGRVVAKIKLPYARGLWPAFWMLGENYRTVAWPICGEIDIMENFGARNQDASRTHGTVHGPGFPGRGLTASSVLPNQGRFADDYHVFGMEWSENSIAFTVDGRSFGKEVTPQSVREAGDTGRWVFNEKFFMILNLAVGGSPAPVGYPDAQTPFPQDMLVNYVKVYQRNTP